MTSIFPSPTSQGDALATFVGGTPLSTQAGSVGLGLFYGVIHALV